MEGAREVQEGKSGEASVGTHTAATRSRRAGYFFPTPCNLTPALLAPTMPFYPFPPPNPAPALANPPPLLTSTSHWRTRCRVSLFCITRKSFVVWGAPRPRALLMVVPGGRESAVAVGVRCNELPLALTKQRQAVGSLLQVRQASTASPQHQQSKG